MADTSRFGRGAQFGDRISPSGEGGSSADCAQCEAMLADALDGTLSAEDHALFAAHTATCGPCEGMLADARRGAAWLEMLRHPRPEPPAELLERILAQTSGAAPVAGAMPVVAAAGFGSAAVHGWWGTGLGSRIRLAMRGWSESGGLLQPRLAMTAAMAFFSIALTMNLTGVRLSQLRPGDLSPATLRRTFSEADVRVVQYYTGLRFVYELESRVHELETAPDDSGSAPAQTPSAEPDSPAPAEQPGTSTAPKSSKPAPGPGSSRRETPIPHTRIEAVAQIEDGAQSTQAAVAMSTKKVGSLV